MSNLDKKEFSPASDVAPRTGKRKSIQRRNLLIGVGEGMLATPWVFLSIPGNFILAALLTQFLGLDKATYGLIVSLPAWCNACQVVFIPCFARFLTPRELALGLSWFNIGLWTMFVALLGMLPEAPEAQVRGVLIVFFVFASLSGAFLGVGWTSWVRDWVPTQLRGTYFGRRNLYIGLVNVSYFLAALLLFEYYDNSLLPFQGLILLAVLLRYAGIIWQHGIRTDSDANGLIHEGWTRHLRDSMRAPGLLLYIGFSAWVGFWLAFVGPFVPVYCFEELGMSPGHFTVLVVLGTLSGIGAWSFWGRLNDRLGCIPLMVFGLLAWELQNYLWLILTPENLWVLYPMFLWGGFFSVAYFLGSFNLLLNLVPDKTRVAGISLNLALTSIAAGTASMLAGVLLTHFIEAGHLSGEVYRMGFFIKSTAVLAGLVLLKKIKEPRRSSRSSVPGAFRTLRQLLAVQGTGFFVNITPLRKKK